MLGELSVRAVHAAGVGVRDGPVCLFAGVYLACWPLGWRCLVCLCGALLVGEVQTSD